MSKLELDGVEYDVSNPSKSVTEQMTNINFMDYYSQKNNELVTNNKIIIQELLGVN